MVMPRQPREARSSTAHTRLRQLLSPGSRPITFTRRRVSPKVRSINRPCRADQAELVSPRVRGESLAVGLEGLDDAVMSLRLVGPAALFGVVAQQSDVAKLFAQDG
jgi:hypothetical protein